MISSQIRNLSAALISYVSESQTHDIYDTVGEPVAVPAKAVRPPPQLRPTPCPSGPPPLKELTPKQGDDKLLYIYIFFYIKY